MRVHKNGFGLLAGVSAASAIIALAPSSGLRDVDDKGFCANSYSFGFIATAQAMLSDSNAIRALRTEPTDDSNPELIGTTHHYSWSAVHTIPSITHATDSETHTPESTTTFPCNPAPCGTHTAMSHFHQSGTGTFPPDYFHPVVISHDTISDFVEDHLSYHNPVSDSHAINSDYHYHSTTTHRSNSDYVGGTGN